MESRVIRDGVGMASSFFLMLGGGFNGGIGTKASWIIGAVICLGLILATVNKRRAKKAKR